MTRKLATRLLWCCAVAGLLLFVEQAIAQNQSMDCTSEPTTHVKLAEGDESGPTHLQLGRKVSNGATIDPDVCDADVTVKGGKDHLLRVSVDFEKGAPKLPAADYLHALDVTPEYVRLKLYLPKQPRAKVVIVVPANRRERSSTLCAAICRLKRTGLPAKEKSTWSLAMLRFWEMRIRTKFCVSAFCWAVIMIVGNRTKAPMEWFQNRLPAPAPGRLTSTW
jgi:hypothetical protein